MKKLVAVGVLACAVMAFGEGDNSATEQKLTQMENELWAGWKAHSPEPFKKYLGDFTSITGSGVGDSEMTIKGISSPDCTIQGSTIDSTNFKWMDKNSVLMTYHATQDATCGSEKLPPAVWAATLWTKKGGDWKAVFHQETTATDKK
jgi:hypothetical protein